jgi:cob(I)alamin adenosyltransferase
MPAIALGSGGAPLPAAAHAHRQGDVGHEEKRVFSYNPDVKLYTRGGDAGETALFDGTRVSKADARVDAYGAVDELNAVLGLVRAAGVDGQIDGLLTTIQRDLFALGSRLADPREKVAARVEKAWLGPDDVTRLEAWIDQFEAELPPLRNFILPGGCRAGAALHVARTVCRRAERRIVALGPALVSPDLIAYSNRLSDLLFVLARLVNHRAGDAEIEW